MITTAITTIKNLREAQLFLKNKIERTWITATSTNVTKTTFRKLEKTKNYSKKNDKTYNKNTQKKQ